MSKVRSFQEVVEHILYMLNFGTSLSSIPNDLILEFKSRINNEQSDYTKDLVTNDQKGLIYIIGEMEYRLNELLDKENNIGVNMLVEEKQCILYIQQLLHTLCDQVLSGVSVEWCEDKYLES